MPPSKTSDRRGARLVPGSHGEVTSRAGRGQRSWTQVGGASEEGLRGERGLTQPITLAYGGDVGGGQDCPSRTPWGQDREVHQTKLAEEQQFRQGSEGHEG